MNTKTYVKIQHKLVRHLTKKGQRLQTTFILHGGFTPKKENEDNSDFYKEILKDAPRNVRILIVPFAKDIERIAPTTERVMREFNQYRWQEKLDFEVANEQSFIAQVRSADIVYFQGGTSVKLLGVLKRFPGLKELLKGKIVAGESAGANVLGMFFFGPSANGVFEGLGILPVKIIPHYKEEYKDAFMDIGQDLESVFLKEYEFRVINRIQFQFTRQTHAD